MGDSGAGKSHRLIALCIEAATQGFRVRYVLATELEPLWDLWRP